MASLTSAINSLFKDCMSVRSDESVLILVDKSFHDLGFQFYKSAQDLTKKPSLVVLPPITNHSCEPPKSISSFMVYNDVIVILTSDQRRTDPNIDRNLQRNNKVKSKIGRHTDDWSVGTTIHTSWNRSYIFYFKNARICRYRYDS